MDKKTFEEYCKSVDEVNIKPNGNLNRSQRRTLSELRSEGIVFVSVGNYLYKRIEICTQVERDNYIESRIASLRTEYFNSIRSIKDFISDEQLKTLYEGIELLD